MHDTLEPNRQAITVVSTFTPWQKHTGEGSYCRRSSGRKEVAFRGDAAFAGPQDYETLEGRGVKYAIRIPANGSLERDIIELLLRPVGRPSQKP